MKILLALPGHLRTVPMGRFATQALRELGHEVLVFDYWPNKSEKIHHTLLGNWYQEAYAKTNERFRRQIEQDRPDLMLAIYGFHLSVESLNYLKQRNILSVCWWLNDPFQFERSLQKAPEFDYLFTNSKGSVAAYRQAGVNAYWLPTACEPTVHKPVALQPEYACEVCFAGDWSPLREQWVEQLARYYDVKVFGPWEGKMRSTELRSRLVHGLFTPEMMATMFASAKVVLNIHTWYGKWSHGTNPRLFEAAACKTAQAVDWKEELPDLFDCEQELLVYRDLADLIAKLKPLLANDQRRTAMAVQAQQQAYAQHTYQQRMTQLLTMVA